MEREQDQVPHRTDLENCDSEPIHIPGSIQAHGHLVAVSEKDHTVINISLNSVSIFGAEASSLVGTDLKDLVVGRERYPLGERLAGVLKGINVKDLPGAEPCRFQLGDLPYNAIMHRHDESVIIELEPADGSTRPLAVQQVMLQAFAQFQTISSVKELLDKAARYVHQVTGYDRVMVYRFHPDWHGEVVTEVKRDDQEAMIGLHFPATDIPEQARRLYALNMIRQIADVHSAPVPIIPTLRHDTNKPLDLTNSALRAVSPVHIEYLRNMGVGASMSISLMYRQKLWGLIACHNNEARFVDHDARMTCRFIGQMLSASLEHRQDGEERERSLKAQERTASLQQRMVRDWNVEDALTQDDGTLLQLMNATGAALVFEGKIHRMGVAPDEQTIASITEWLREQREELIFRTNELPRLLPSIEEQAEKASGLLAIALSQELGEYILWFKPETMMHVDWAGAPEKGFNTMLNGQGLATLGPRKSFAKWTEEVKFTSTPWTRTDLAVAHKLREDVLQGIARKSNEIRKLNDKLRVAYDELDTFSYTISHDLRTPLSAIRNYGEYLLMQYGGKVDPELDDVLDRVVRGTDKMSRLIEHVLNYSRLGRTDLNGSMLDMNALLSEIKDEVVSADIHPDAGSILRIGETPPIWGDRTMITQVFTNLISNAVKYSHKVQKPLIRVEGRENEFETIYTVQDNGVGIDMEQASHVFELFKRLDNAMDFEGSGVGLAIVKRIIERHNGKIWFDSEPGEGTVFHVCFPKRAGADQGAGVNR